MRRALIILVDAYRYLLSPWLGSNCRFYPSCSCYAREAIQIHGAYKGTILGLRRIGRCHPWHPGGYDPVLESSENEQVTHLTSFATSTTLKKV